MHLFDQANVLILLLFCLDCHGLQTRVFQEFGQSSPRAVVAFQGGATMQDKSFPRRPRMTYGYTASTSRLFLHKSPQEEEDNKSTGGLGIHVPSSYTLLTDSLAILLAVELVGVLREINDVDFARNGGWFQPLPTFQEQSMSISKVLQGWIINVALWATTLTIIPLAVGKEWNRRDANPWITRFVPAFLGFATLRILYALLLMPGDSSIASSESALVDTYTVGLLLSTARYLLGNEE